MRVQCTLFSLLLASGAAYADWSYNLTPGVTPISHDIFSLHMLVFWICVVIAALVFGTMFYSMLHHRKSKGFKPAEFHEHSWVEITWTIIPLLILVLIAIPATRVLVAMNNEDQSDITIKITGYQWKWHYEYLDQGITFFSNMNTPYDQIQGTAPKTADYLRTVDHPLVLPIHKKIRFLMTSNDVIHSWWVPDLGVKRDALPGFINEAWARINKPGTYHGQCTELCGINHAYMPIVVEAVSEQDFNKWVAQQKGQGTETAADVNKVWTKDDLMKQGEQVYLSICAACHQPTGLGLPPTFPALKGSPIVTGPVEGHMNRVMNGKPGTAMQAFKNQLNDIEIAAVITYERNSFGNNTGTIVQPSQILAARGGAQPAAVAQPAATTQPAATAQPAAAPQSTTPAQPATAAPTTATTQPAAAQSTTQPAAATQPSTASAQSPDAVMQQGEKIFLGTCAVCHQATGLGMPPIYPALKGSPIATGPLSAHLNRVLNGKPGTAMQAFKDQLSDDDLAAVITYERNSWGNNTSGTVQVVTPAQVNAARSLPPAP